MRSEIGGVADGDADLGHMAAARQVEQLFLDGRLAGAEGVDLALHQHAAAQAQASSRGFTCVLEHGVHFGRHAGHGGHDGSRPCASRCREPCRMALGIGSAPAGNRACTRLRSGMVPIAAGEHLPGSGASDVFVQDQLDAGGLGQGLARQVVQRRAEAAGDQDQLGPPAAMRKASMLSSRSSATVVCQPTAMPISARRWLSHWLLVSRFWPLVSSLPMEMISLSWMLFSRGRLRLSVWHTPSRKRPKRILTGNRETSTMGGRVGRCSGSVADWGDRRRRLRRGRRLRMDLAQVQVNRSERRLIPGPRRHFIWALPSRTIESS